MLVPLNRCSFESIRHPCHQLSPCFCLQLKTEIKRKFYSCDYFFIFLKLFQAFYFYFFFLSTGCMRTHWQGQDYKQKGVFCSFTIRVLFLFKLSLPKRNQILFSFFWETANSNLSEFAPFGENTFVAVFFGFRFRESFWVKADVMLHDCHLLGLPLG